MTIVASSIAYDNCLAPSFKDGEVKSFYILHENELLFDHIRSEKMEDSCGVTFIGSSRQSFNMDRNLSEEERNGSCFEQYNKVTEYLGNELIRLLMADIDNGLSAGTSFFRAIDNENILEHGDCVPEETKVSLLYLQMHHLSNIHPKEGAIESVTWNARLSCLKSFIRPVALPVPIRSLHT